jgi:hypothetical protein
VSATTRYPPWQPIGLTFWTEAHYPLFCWSRLVTAGLSGLCPVLFPTHGDYSEDWEAECKNMLQGFARCEPLCLEYPHIPISECLNPVEVIYQTALATIRTAKDLSLVPMHMKCLTLLTAENVHDQNKFEAKHGYFMESSPLTRIGCTPNQKVVKKAISNISVPAPRSLDKRCSALGWQNLKGHTSSRLLLQPHHSLGMFAGSQGCVESPNSNSCVPAVPNDGPDGISKIAASVAFLSFRFMAAMGRRPVWTRVVWRVRAEQNSQHQQLDATAQNWRLPPEQHRQAQCQEGMLLHIRIL